MFITINKWCFNYHVKLIASMIVRNTQIAYSNCRSISYNCIKINYSEETIYFYFYKQANKLFTMSTLYITK